MREFFLIIICILFYGSATFFKRLGLIQLHPYQFLLISGICYVLATPLWMWLMQANPPVTQYSGQSILFVIIYALFNVVAGLVLAFLLQNTKSPGTLIVMINLSSLVTLLLSYLFLNEQLSATKILAVALAVISLILMNC